jgi:hypothetical protein
MMGDARPYRLCACVLAVLAEADVRVVPQDHPTHPVALVFWLPERHAHRITPDALCSCRVAPPDPGDRPHLRLL